MVVGDGDVPALLVVVATVVVAPDDGRTLLGVGTYEVDVRVRVDLRLLQGGQLGPVQSDRLVGAQRAAHLPAVPPIADSEGSGGVTAALTGVGAGKDRNTALTECSGS